MEQNFDAQLSLFKVEMNNKLSCFQNSYTPKETQRNTTSKYKETNKIRIMSSEIDALNVRMRNVEIANDEKATEKAEPKINKDKKVSIVCDDVESEAHASTPRGLSGNLPWGLPSDFSKSTQKPKRKHPKPQKYIYPGSKEAK